MTEYRLSMVLLSVSHKSKFLLQPKEKGNYHLNYNKVAKITYSRIFCTKTLFTSTQREENLERLSLLKHELHAKTSSLSQSKFH